MNFLAKPIKDTFFVFTKNFMNNVITVLFHCCCSVTQLCPTLCNPVDCSTPGFVDLYHPWSMLKLLSVELVIPSRHLILCCPLLLLPSVFPSIRVFFNKSAVCIGLPKYWSFSISSSSEYSELISFRIHWLTLQSNGFSRFFSSTTVQRHSAFLIVWFSYPYETTGKPYF